MKAFSENTFKIIELGATRWAGAIDAFLTVTLKLYEDLDMGIFSRISDIINSNIAAILDKAEDPEKLIRLMIQEMEDTLVEVRSAAARTIAEKKEISRKLVTLESEAGDWLAKAELAVAKGRDDLAKAALREKTALEDASDALRDQIEQADESLIKLNEDIGRLQAKLADAKARQEALVLRHEAAAKRLRLRQQLHDNKLNDALLRFEKFERKVDNLEGRVEAYDLGKRADLRQEFRDLEDDDRVEQALDAIKQKVTGKRPSEDV